MIFELTRIGWPNTATVVALALLPAVVLAGGVGKPQPVIGVPAAQAATSCPLTGEALVLLTDNGPALPPARS